MSNPETKKIYLPWYKCFREEFSKASKYILAVEYEPLVSKTIKPETLEIFDKETLARFIFESNNIEREGLPFGETRELILLGLEEYPLELFDNEEQEQQNFKKFISLLKQIKEDTRIDFGILNHSNILNNSKEEQNQSGYELIAKYGGKNKEADKVIQYFLATRDVNHYTITHRLSHIRDILLSRFRSRAKVKFKSRKKLEEIDKQLEKIFASAPSNIGPLITEERIKSLHELMADGLVDEKNAKAGQYRTKPIMTDMESHYPAPGDIPAAMANFVTKYAEYEAQDLNPIALAAWASTQFVLIHPFADFNGRMSRLLINMILRAHGVPFWVSLRSSGKERTRYLTALKHYRRKNYLSIATLISMQLNRGFEDLNDMLELSGHPLITIDQVKDFPREWSDNELYFHTWDQ